MPRVDKALTKYRYSCDSRKIPTVPHTRANFRCEKGLVRMPKWSGLGNAVSIMRARAL